MYRTALSERPGRNPAKSVFGGKINVIEKKGKEREDRKSIDKQRSQVLI